MLTPTPKRAFLAVAISSLLFACRREVPLAPPDQTTGTQSIERSLVTTRANLNPLAGQPGQDTAPAITFTRVVGVMARNGVNVVSET